MNQQKKQSTTAKQPAARAAAKKAYRAPSVRTEPVTEATVLAASQPGCGADAIDAANECGFAAG